MDYSIMKIDCLTEPQVEVMKKVFRDAFPESGALQLADHDITSVLVDGDEPVGLSVCRPLGSTPWLFLRYLAVSPTSQSRGLGGILWQNVLRQLSFASARLLVLEVEDPAVGDEDEVHQRKRRIAFYQRQGAVVLPISGYLEPQPVATTGKPMKLMAAARKGHPVPELGSAQLADLVRAIYKHRYSLDSCHQLVARAVSGIVPQ